jgi:hypothetical protein
MIVEKIVLHGKFGVNGREVEILTGPWSDADIGRATKLAGSRVRIVVEPEPPPPEPLTGTNADVGVLVRVLSGPNVSPEVTGRIGVLRRYSGTGFADVLFERGEMWSISCERIERAPVDCPHCGAVQVAR